MKTLDTLELPLNCVSLIEASAGTGKTFTMANLYLRLLLGVGYQPLTVEQILVVTFTKAATEELRDRIRRNTKACREYFQHPSEAPTGNEKFFHQLLDAVAEHKDEAILRLLIAEREIDLASIFTIHSFCQKMLFQFAFNSGMRFDSDLQPDESELLKRLSEEVWRELFYPLGLKETQIVAETLGTPDNALDSIRALVATELPTVSAENAWLKQDFSQYLADLQQFIIDAKAHWLQHRTEIIALIEAELAKEYKKGEKKALSRRSYQARYVEGWKTQLNTWAEGAVLDFPSDLFSRFCLETLIEKAEEGADPLSAPLFAKNQAILTAYQSQFDGKLKALLNYQFLQALQAKLEQYKATHSEKSFNDMLTYLNRALKAEQGEMLARQIRQQFAFAMIDEFQDTDNEQYEIFSKIFMNAESEQGFIMIGDPKQSIYKFRGADIFTYLKASNEAQEKRTLPQNWRSLPPVVEATNCLFTFPADTAQSPFLYQGIQFQAVKTKETEDKLFGSYNALSCYLQNEFNENQAAEWAAYHIQQQLKQAEQGTFGVQTTEGAKTFKAKDIAILVRSKAQAHLMKNALNARGLPSVFLSEDRSVYATDTAQDLLLILRAVHEPQQAKAVLSALGSGLWALTAQEIYQLKSDEMRWDAQIENFVQYQQLWFTQGVLSMLHKLFIQEGIIERIRNNPNEADRRLTDLMHLTELLQKASPMLENESALLRWYERQLDEPTGAEDQVLRLESEEEIIKIITIHGSKGLQYPIVWLPFVGKNFIVRGAAMSLYRDEDDQLRLNLNASDRKAKELIEQAEYAEDLRLLYVALTRAESQMNVILPAQFPKGWNAMHYLLSNGELGCRKDYETKTSTAEYLKAKQISGEPILLTDEIPSDDWTPTIVEHNERAVRIFERKIESPEQITSFTSLYEYHQWREQKQPSSVRTTLFDEAKDVDLQEEIAEDDLDVELNEPNEFSPYQFPHGARVGTVLHSFFEHHDFTQAVENSQISAICEALDLDESWLEPTKNWLEQVLATPIGDTAFSLKEIPNKQRLNEWQFYLRLNNANALQALNQLLYEHHGFKQDLQLPELEGYVRGFIDCIAKVGEQFYVIDYKSNFLGYRAEDYQAGNIFQSMLNHRYDLQYLLYSLALHRYLRSRLGENYDYERDFGGIAYLFLRGMNGEKNHGVFFDKPKKALIEGMDLLFE